MAAAWLSQVFLKACNGDKPEDQYVHDDRIPVMISVDIAFCVDVTFSMQHCIDQLKSCTGDLVDGLRVNGARDIGLGLLGYRNRHENGPSCWKKSGLVCEDPWFFRDFTPDIRDFLSWLDDEGDVQANGGGESNDPNAVDDPESALDALFLTVNQFSWRGDSLKAILFFTDSGSYDTISEMTYHSRDKRGDMDMVIEEIRKLPNLHIYIRAPLFPIYELLHERLGEETECMADAKLFEIDELKNGLANMDFNELMNYISKTLTWKNP